MPSLAEMQQSIRDRLRELQPLVSEYNELAELERRWDQALGRTGAQAEREPAPARRRRRDGGAGGRAGRRRVPVAERRAQILKLIGERPMIDAGDLAREIGLSRPRVTQLTAELQRDGAITRSGAGFLAAPAGNAPGPGAEEAAANGEPVGDDAIALDPGDMAADESAHPAEAELERHEEEHA